MEGPCMSKWVGEAQQACTVIFVWCPLLFHSFVCQLHNPTLKWRIQSGVAARE